MQGTFIHILFLLDASDAQCIVQHVAERTMYKYFTVGLSPHFVTARLMETFSHFISLTHTKCDSLWYKPACVIPIVTTYTLSGCELFIFRNTNCSFSPLEKTERRDLSKTFTLRQRVNRPGHHTLFYYYVLCVI